MRNMIVTDVNTMAGGQEYCAHPPVIPTQVLGLVKQKSVLRYSDVKPGQPLTQFPHKQGQEDGRKQSRQ